MKFKKVKQRGQVLVFYALMIPILLLFAGVGLDLGWYYLNVSRLQHAADAAVLAGAHKLNDEHETFKNKNTTKFDSFINILPTNGTTRPIRQKAIKLRRILR